MSEEANKVMDVKISTNLQKARALHVFVIEQFVAHISDENHDLLNGLRDMRWMLELDLIPQLEAQS